MTCYIAMSAHQWGLGDTVEEARLRMKQEGARLTEPHVVFELPAHATKPYVDDIGRVGWTWDEGHVPPKEDLHERSKLRVAFVRAMPKFKVGELY